MSPISPRSLQPSTTQLILVHKTSRIFFSPCISYLHQFSRSPQRPPFHPESAVARAGKLLGDFKNVTSLAAIASRAKALLQALQRNAVGIQAALAAAVGELVALLRRYKLTQGLADFVETLPGRFEEFVKILSEKVKQLGEEWDEGGAKPPNPKAPQSIGKGPRKFDPNKVRFSQKTVSYTKKRPSGDYTYDDILNGMKKDGWKGPPVDVVKMPDGGITSMDNTRIAAAREATAGGANVEIEANVHDYNEPLTNAEQFRFSDPDEGFKPATWGQAIDHRIGDQGTGWSAANPMGSTTPPKITGRPQ